MAVVTFFVSLFTAIANVKQLAEYADKFASMIMLWYVQSSQSATLSQIADAAAMSARAQTQEDRFKAAEAWQRALSRPRVY